MGPTSDTQHSKETRVTPDTSRIATYIPGVQSLEVGSQVVLRSGYWITATWRGVETRLAGKFFAGMKNLLVQLSSWTGEFPPMWRFSAALCWQTERKQIENFPQGSGKTSDLNFLGLSFKSNSFSLLGKFSKASTSQVSLGWREDVAWDLLLTLSTPLERNNDR